MTSPAICGLLLGVLLAGRAATQTPGIPPPQRPPCEQADNEHYGYTREQAIQVGGSPIYGAARQRRYLDALRGPEGQIVTYKRLGQVGAPDGTILDAYEVTYQGLEKPVRLFLDWYHYTPPRLPRGFTCGGPISLGLPPVDPFQQSDQLRALAVAQATTADLSPIPAGLEGKPPAALIYDQFRLLALAARAAAAKGISADPKNPPEALKDVGMVVLNLPYTCNERLLAASGVAIHGPDGRQVPRAEQQALSSDQLARVLPAITMPAGAKAFAYQLARPRPNDTIVTAYLDDGCEIQGNALRLPVHVTPVEPRETPSPEVPEGAKTPATVFLQAIVDFEGRFREPVYIGGPNELVAAAREAIAQWRAEPARINGAPIAVGVLLQVRFGSF